MVKRALLALALALALIAAPASATGPDTVNYGGVALSGGFQAGHFDDVWDLTACDMTLTFTYNATGMVDDFGGNAHAWAEIGVREVGHGDFNPTWMAEGAGVWLATDYDWTANTFDPVGALTLDLDDKLILQKGGGMGESAYDLPSPPPNPWANHAVWFDRDGADQWQAQMWGAIDGVTYNTGGTCEVCDCTTIQDGTLRTSDGAPIVLGFDEWGYNYQAHLFNGMYCDAYRDAAWCHPYKDIGLMMKWNDAWLSNKDCDSDGNYELDGETCMWNYFVKIVAAPADGHVEEGVWYAEDGTEIGPVIWGSFAIIQQVENDLCAGLHGVQYLSPSGAGLGHW